jgi:hypothetical protein
MRSIAARLDEVPDALWIALAIFGLVVWWPLGLAVLAYILWSGRMRCCGLSWNNEAHAVDRASNRSRRPRTSGNQAFDEYRAETLRRLEEEQQAFQEYLGRLRTAKDRAEFDAFMAERRSPPGSAS